MALTSNIGSYQVFLSSHLHNHEWEASIILLENKIPVIDLRFVSDPSAWASKGKILANAVSIIYLGIDRYDRILDLLRNEKPLTAVLYSQIGSVPPRVLIQTGMEITGEAEA